MQRSQLPVSQRGQATSRHTGYSLLTALAPPAAACQQHHSLRQHALYPVCWASRAPTAGLSDASLDSAGAQPGCCTDLPDEGKLDVTVEQRNIALLARSENACAPSALPHAFRNATRLQQAFSPSGPEQRCQPQCPWMLRPSVCLKVHGPACSKAEPTGCPIRRWCSPPYRCKAAGFELNPLSFCCRSWNCCSISAAMGFPCLLSRPYSLQVG